MFDASQNFLSTIFLFVFFCMGEVFAARKFSSQFMNKRGRRYCIKSNLITNKSINCVDVDTKCQMQTDEAVDRDPLLSKKQLMYGFFCETFNGMLFVDFIHFLYAKVLDDNCIEASSVDDGRRFSFSRALEYLSVPWIMDCGERRNYLCCGGIESLDVVDEEKDMMQDVYSSVRHLSIILNEYRKYTKEKKEDIFKEYLSNNFCGADVFCCDAKTCFYECRFVSDSGGCDVRISYFAKYLVCPSDFEILANQSRRICSKDIEMQIDFLRKELDLLCSCYLK